MRLCWLTKGEQVSKWSFFGKVIPERVPVTLGMPLEGSATQPSLGFSFNFRIVIHNSQVIADVEIADGATDLTTLRNSVADHVRMITDIIGFERGYYLEVEIISAVSQETREWIVFGIEIPVLASRRRTREIDLLNVPLLNAVAKNIPAQQVLADFREAMKVPVGTGFFCYRAIEAMMQSIKVKPEEKDSPAWDRLRATLCIDRSVIDDIKQHADFPPRHGKPTAITDAERAKVFGLTAEIIERFLQYLIRGGKALPPQDFPVLKSTPPSA